MNKITNHLPTAELQAIDAAHHMHPFSSNDELREKGARVIARAKGIYLTDTDGNELPKFLTKKVKMNAWVYV